MKERYGFYRRPLKPGGIMLHSRLGGRNSGGHPIGPRSTSSLSRSAYYRNDMTPTDSERIQSAFGSDVQHVYLLMILPDALNRFLNEIDLSWY